jgi:hypothetical protein
MAYFSRTKTLVGVVAASGLIAVGAAVAATAASPLPAAVQRLLDCRETAADGARLACYDQAVGELGRLLAAGEIIVVDKERVATVKRQAFGLSLPSLNIFDRGDKPQELAEVAATAVRVHRKLDGHWSLELDDGAVWEQTDDEKFVRLPRVGSKVVIRKAAFGSFLMKIDDQWPVRAQRVR